jgi:hypothetical protein
MTKAPIVIEGSAIVMTKASIVIHRSTIVTTTASIVIHRSFFMKTIDEIVKQKGEVVAQAVVFGRDIGPRSTPSTEKIVPTTTQTNHRSLVALKLSTVVAALIAFAQTIVKAMSGNPLFPNPSPTLAVLQQAIADLQTAQTAALARTKGAVITRDEKKVALVALLQQMKGYVQTIADANVENGASIIASAGFAVRKAPTRAPRVFAAKPGKISGTAALVAGSAARRSAYEWEYSTDGGKTWVVTPSTLQAKSTIVGLTPGSTVVFRYRAVTKTGEGDWSQVVSLIIK